MEHFFVCFSVIHVYFLYSGGFNRRGCEPQWVSCADPEGGGGRGS